jgi:putative aminopeptidase FrvX
MQMTASGALAGCVSIPTRYIHTGVEMIDLADCDACVDLTMKLLAYNLNN